MANPTQTMVSKGIPNPLIAESLLKILRDLIPVDSLPKSLTNFCPWNGKITQNNIHFPNEMNHKSNLSCYIKSLIVRL